MVDFHCVKEQREGSGNEDGVLVILSSAFLKVYSLLKLDDTYEDLPDFGIEETRATFHALIRYLSYYNIEMLNS